MQEHDSEDTSSRPRILKKEVNEGRYTLSDPHHGVVDLFWKGNYIWGVLDLAEPDLRTKYLKLFEEGLKK